MTNQYSPEIIALRDQVIRGNQKLWEAWLQIRELAHNTEEWSKQMDRWAEAQQRLHLLCSELKLRGFTDCLYIKYYEGLTEEEEKAVMEEIVEGKVTEVQDGVKIKNCLSNPDEWWCCVCPSNINYWEKELMSLPGPSMSKVKQPEFVPGQTKFLTKLGEEG